MSERECLRFVRARPRLTARKGHRGPRGGVNEGNARDHFRLG